MAELNDYQKKAILEVLEKATKEYGVTLTSLDIKHVYLELDYLKDTSKDDKPEYRKSIHVVKKKIVEALEQVKLAYNEDGHKKEELDFWSSNLQQALNLCLVEGDLKSRVVGDWEVGNRREIEKSYFDSSLKKLVINHLVDLYAKQSLFMYKLEVFWYKYINKQPIPKSEGHYFFQLASAILSESGEKDYSNLCFIRYKRNKPRRN